MSLTDAAKIAQSAGLFGEPDAEIKQSWFFTLMGRATATVMLVFGYLAALGLIYSLFGEDLKKLHAEHPWFFYGAIGGPLLLVLIFSVIPTIRRGVRERRLHPLASREGEVREGYYRLRPYDEADADAYSRPDGAVEDALGWLKGAEETVLYLSGGSGTGKSSLVSAGIVPALKQDGWRVLAVRGLGDPMAALDAALRAEVGLFATPPTAEADVTDMLAAIAEETRRVEAAPLLIVLDQFEEYLILESESEKSSYAEFLRALSDAPLPGIRLLHVFREDYRALLFKEGFPDYLPRRTGFELAPFNRREAEQFLRGGPQNLDQRGYDALFAGLDRIEDARGIYRPITLNMIGFVLGQQSGTLNTDPGRLIERYLKDAIARGPARDFAPTVLQAMITREGTKQVQSVEAIAEATRVEPWQVKATLVDLEDDRLVRPLAQGMWEISHDFLARLIGQVLGRTRTGGLTRFATPALGLALIGWVAAVAVAMPAWNEYRVRAALDRIAGANMLRDANAEDGGLSFVAKKGFNDENLQAFGQAASALDLKALNLSGTAVTDLSPIRNLRIERLTLSGLTGVTDLSPLAGMNLRFLQLYGTPIHDPAPLLEMPLEGLTIDLSQSKIDPSFLAEIPLNDLTLGLQSNVRDLEFLSGLKLKRLDVQRASNLRRLDALKGMPLEELILIGAAALTDLRPLRGAPLKKLNLSSAVRIKDLEALRGMPLEWLDLTGAHQLDDLGPLEAMPLKWLNISYLERVMDLAPLKGMPLQNLFLSGLSQVRNLEALSNMPLEVISLDNMNAITTLRPLSGSKLREVYLFRNDRLVSLEGLENSVIQHLSLAEMPALRDISAISELPLQTLSMAQVPALRDISAISELPLETLSISDVPLLTDLSPLNGLTLSSLYLTDLENVSDLGPLAGSPVIYLTLSDMPMITDIEPLRGMRLQSLVLSGSTGVSDLTPLEGMPLETLALDRLDRVTDLSPLKGMPLYTLSLIGAEGVTDLTPLKGTGLQSISLLGATGIVDLSPLKGMQRNYISGVPELLETLD